MVPAPRRHAVMDARPPRWMGDFNAGVGPTGVTGRAPYAAWSRWARNQGAARSDNHPMRRTYVSLYVHAVWSTEHRAALLEEVWEAHLYATMGARCVDLGACPIAIGGVADHVHVLARLPATLAPSRLVGDLKGETSHLIRHRLKPGCDFHWQRGYGVFSVSARGTDFVREYVLTQRHHHAVGTLIPTLERTHIDGY
ncbi:MAG: IS200/IS605 family transposase [Deltaproteobacteria bacterium]|nr:IS200/IS605 family transposase [Deltaproteobacteria bacterium]